jgi:hypothetical protein
MRGGSGMEVLGFGVATSFLYETNTFRAIHSVMNGSK